MTTRVDGLSRRDFVSATAAALAGVSVATAADKPYGDFTVGFQSYCFRNFNTEQTLKRARDLGLLYVEFFEKHLPANSTPEQIKPVIRLCDSYGIKPVGYFVGKFTKNHDENRRSFELGRTLGIKNLTVGDPDRDSFDSLDKLCEEYQTSVAIHPHGPVGNKLHPWYSAKIILDAVKNRHPLIGTCLDTGHLIRAEQLGEKLDPAQEIRTMGARNFAIHLKDHDNRRKTDVVYGKGALNVGEVLKALKEVKFKGYIAVEYEANPDNPSPDMAACLEVLRDSVRMLG